MIRIVGIQRNSDPQADFALLQNQGNMRQMLRGHVLLPESAIGEQSSEAIVLNDAVAINSSQYVLVTSGHGENGWTMSRDGAQVYKVYLNRNNSFWSQFEGTVHVLSIHHSWSERKEAVLVS